MPIIKELKKGDYILHKDEPHMVRKNQIIVTGTHSHTKNKVEMVGLFSGRSESLTFPPHDAINTLDIIRKQAQLIAKSGEKVQIMDLVSYETLDADVNGAIEMEEGDTVIYVSFQGSNTVVENTSRG